MASSSLLHIRPGVSCQCIVAGATEQRVVAGASLQVVVTGTAGQLRWDAQRGIDDACIVSHYIENICHEKFFSAGTEFVLTSLAAAGRQSRGPDCRHPDPDDRRVAETRMQPEF